MNGGNLLVYVDPLGVLDARDNPSPNPMGGPPVNSDLPELFSAWGVDYSPNKVVADPNAIFGGERDNMLTFLALKEENMDREDILTSRLNLCAMYNAGSFKVDPPEGITVTKLIKSSDVANHVGDMQARFGGQALSRDFTRGKEALNLAVRLSGKFKSAFPDGPPAKPEEDKADGAGTPATTHLSEASSESIVILVGDVDMIYDEANFQMVQTPFGNQAIRQNDNPFLFGNAVEQVVLGSPELTLVRARNKTDRYFEKVRQMEMKAQAAAEEQDKQFEQELEQANNRLRELQVADQESNGRLILGAEAEQEIDKLRKKILQLEKDRRELRKTLREDIEALGFRVKLSSIFLMPFMILVFGIGFSVYRRSKTA
jgi:ABC-type uncharacterized transport system involved in gliding motility auxiliary subunit